ncbi:YopX family protein [Alteribacter populi]|uniref:YopX family protein n=1 Tax=Alteribacter populi TaxID=2011011 RepID=UPI000BBB5591|nr:YopX family protein [Alteribacter populi]
MREIKFRGWDEVGKKMYYNMKSLHGTLMQYTGLKDINEKDIYEGDIVRYVNDSHVKRTGIVVFKNASFAIENPTITSYRLIDYSIEIIGNIYEE